MQINYETNVCLFGDLSQVLQEKVEDELKRAAMQAGDMWINGTDLLSMLRTLNEGIKYGDANEVHLTAAAREYKAQLHLMRSTCLFHMVRIRNIFSGLQ